MMSNQLVESPATAQLLDGRVVSLRRLTGDDTEAALALHQRLTDHDRYFRFFTLSPIDLDQLVGEMIEPAHGRYALGAFDADQLIGVAHYTVVCADPKVAEIAIVVAHEDHSQGVGTALLKHLAQVARSNGIEQLVADVLGENHLMLITLRDLGWACKPMDCGAVRHLAIELPDFVEEAQPSAAEGS
jgi:GNAT superfamily N-acetyltransferase